MSAQTMTTVTCDRCGTSMRFHERDERAGRAAASVFGFTTTRIFPSGDVADLCHGCASDRSWSASLVLGTAGGEAA